jgi:hypothetical protein
MNRLSTVILALILLTNGLIVLSTTTAFAATQKTCSGGWRITGYFVPVEADYSGPMTKVSVNGLGNVSFPKSFVNATATEGWGLTKAGWYLGKPGADWLKSSIAENAHGGQLKVGSLAVGKYVQLGSTISIPSAPSPWNTQMLSATEN